MKGGAREGKADDAFALGRSVRPDREQLLSMVQPALEGARLDDAPLPGYEIVEEIGRGGMGVVFRAWQTGLGREVAIKRIRAPYPAVTEKFLAEARISGKLDHPGIVPVYDLLRTARGDLALVMKLVRGTSWKELLHPDNEARRRDLDFHLDVLMSVSNAIAFAHSKGLSHNDLKPANVMVGEFGEVLVADWGLALDMRDDPDEDAVAPHRSTLKAPSGTPAYWAPELARGKGTKVGPWTDVYLLGAILHEIATGRPPHRGGDLLSSMMAAIKSELPAFEPGAPPGLEEICRKAMAPGPEARYPSVAAFQEALRAFLSHRESMTISQGARLTLERAVAQVEGLEPAATSSDRMRIHAELGEAAIGFQQALVLWPENPEALEGQRRAVLWLATVTLRNGDLGVAELQVSRLDPGDPEAAVLSARIQAAVAERARAARAARRTRRGLLAAVAVIVVGLTAGLIAARRGHRRVADSRELAMTRLADIRRLSDVKRLADHATQADGLWPARPERAGDMEAWLTGARSLTAHLEGNRAYLEELRRNAEATSPRFRFASAEDQWEHDTLADLVVGLERFALTTIPEVERRLELARVVRRRTLEDPREAWARAIASIADPAECPRYGGLRLTPQLGLVPLGKDARSGLWEFAHVESGEPPSRDQGGEIVLSEATGVVLVLLPGGAFSMGNRPLDQAHREGDPGVDPQARSTEQPAHEVTLAPFFMAKHEITQAQWIRAGLRNPSAYPAGMQIGGRRHTGLHPVEQISWKEADQALARLSLRLPTEAQWEYAARGGTTSIYWTGSKKESLQGATNLADRYCKEHGGPGSWLFELWLDDGYVVHAPVGSYRPNGFGLHEVVGNVWEFVQDHYGGYDLPVSRGDGERLVQEDTPRVFRGGGFRSSSVHARSADRYSLYAPDYRGYDVGVRASRALREGE